LAVKVPSLAERREDIPLLAGHFLAKHSRPGRAVPRLAVDTAQRLMRYEYPGNIRELENIVQRILVYCDGEVVEPQHLVADLRENLPVAVRTNRQDWPPLDAHEKQYIMEVLDEVEGNKSAAAKILGIDRVSLWRKIKRYGLEKPDT
jgi:DNA-binding NtrC family response regulator